MYEPDTKDPDIAKFLTAFADLPDEKRRVALALLGEGFCAMCGSEFGPFCQCWNDE